MFTSRAEYRILLRQDNADQRLTPIASRLGIENIDLRVARLNDKMKHIEKLRRFFEQYGVTPAQINTYLEEKGSAPLKQQVKLISILSRPGVSIEGLKNHIPELAQALDKINREIVDTAEIDIKYEGYIVKEKEMAEKMNRLEDLRIYKDLDFSTLTALSAEAREKLSELRPRTIGQASRISGVSPADISVLLVHIGR